jgi:hypothetical protein
LYCQSGIASPLSEGIRCLSSREPARKYHCSAVGAHPSALVRIRIGEKLRRLRKPPTPIWDAPKKLHEFVRRWIANGFPWQSLLSLPG